MRTITAIFGTGHTTPECQTVGGKTAIEIQVSGKSIVLRYVERGYSFKGTVGDDGSFLISSAVPMVDGRATWSGKIQGARIRGSMDGVGPGGACREVLTAQK